MRVVWSEVRSRRSGTRAVRLGQANTFRRSDYFSSGVWFHVYEVGGGLIEAVVDCEIESTLNIIKKSKQQVITYVYILCIGG